MLFRSDRKSTRLNSSHTLISYAVFCLKKKEENRRLTKHNIRVNRRDRRGDSKTTALLNSTLHCVIALTFSVTVLSVFFFFFLKERAPPRYPPFPPPRPSPY